MPINKSTLEKKWYYRAAKVFLIVLPFIVVIIWLLSLLRGSTLICSFVPKYDIDDLIKTIQYIIVGVAAYFLILISVWRTIRYIVFGNVPDDTGSKKRGSAVESPTGIPTKGGQRGLQNVLPIIILLISILVFFLLSQNGFFEGALTNTAPAIKTSPTPSRCPKTSAQTSTPCGSVKGGVGVSGIIVPASCDCPSDTAYAQMDNITPGGPYKICTCK
ncbi:hypothetical protein KKF59_01920 [Patescibacteria group bacterium]|nr:hypothetical protein [Patescibacteria group bacterium]MBU1034553.1 hypothetical protein [Patescibacteria group bacterium]MBU1629855.1 hypothetical protein [Patescibacteria group bacterium]MBU1907868.1 hypothetical protein [Patescibacteria group bacterium]